MKSDRILGAVTLAVAIAMGALASQFQAPFSYEPIGPARYPILLAILIGACGAWLLVKPGPPAPWPGGALLRKVVLMFAALIGYALVFEPLGFMVATALLTFALGLLFDGTWKRVLVGGLLLGPGLYILFDRLLDVVLPLGTLWAFR
ncbi:MAG: tripartite tricarboxylate transporter TctB family protein [Burkholderiales bacterium]|nr:tripartite tricarboxylate transporter TctB family protein [Burkholderiales bacterium]